MTLRLQLALIALCLTDLILLVHDGLGSVWPLSVLLCWIGLVALWESNRAARDREVLG